MGLLFVITVFLGVVKMAESCTVAPSTTTTTANCMYSQLTDTVPTAAQVTGTDGCQGARTCTLAQGQTSMYMISSACATVPGDNVLLRTSTNTVTDTGNSVAASTVLVSCSTTGVLTVTANGAAAVSNVVSLSCVP